MAFAAWMCASAVRVQAVNRRCERCRRQELKYAPFATWRRFRTMGAVLRSAAES